MTQFTLAALLTLSLASPLAMRTASAGADAPANAPEARLGRIIARLKRDVHVVTQPFLTYHWGKRSALGPGWATPRAADDPEGAAIVRGSVPLYSDTALSVDGNRDGFYAAIDPAITQRYGDKGGRNWVLVRVEIPAGTRFLDTNPYDFDSAFWDAFAIVAAEHRCLRYGMPMDLDSVLVGHPPNDDCEALNRRLVSELAPDFLLYKYPSSAYDGCRTGADSERGTPLASYLNGALLFTRADWIRPELVRVFTYDSIDATDERRMIEAVIADPVGFRPDHAVWPDMTASVLPSDSAMKAWRADHLLACGQKVGPTFRAKGGPDLAEDRKRR